MIRTKLRANQGEAVEQAVELDGFALFSQQRVGKTLPALAIADRLKPDIVFIVCPKNALLVWKKQIREHLEIDWPCRFFRYNYAHICRSAKRRRHFRELFRHKWANKRVLLIIDESQHIKRLGSMQSRMLRSLAHLATYVTELSGTPIDKWEDYYAQFDAIQPGVLGDEYEDFQDEFLIMGGYKDKEIVGYKNKEKFFAIVNKYSYRVTLREAQISEGRKAYVVKKRFVRFDLKPESRRHYRELEKKLETVVNRKKIKTPLVVTLTQKLQQLAGGYLIHKEPLYNEDGTPQLTKKGKPKFLKEIIPVGREKMVQLERLITLDSVFSAEKFVICANYSHELEEIAKRLDRLGRSYKLVDGDHTFDGTFDTDCVLLQVRTAEAIDLAKAGTYIFYSWNHSFIDFQQALFRILEFKTRLVRYYFLMANKTVDQDIYDAVHRKQKLAVLIADRYRYDRKRAA